MKILNLGLDNSVLNKDSDLAKRVVEYGRLVDKYAIIVPAKANKKVELSDNTNAYGVKSGNKAVGLLKICNLAKKLIRQDKFNCLTAQDQYFLGFVALKLARKFKVGLEVQVHGFEKYGGLRKLAAKYILPRANSIRVVSQRLKKRMMEEFHVADKKIIVVPIHRDLRLKIKNLRIKKENDKFIFLTIGRLVPVKNIEMQIRAMRQVIKEHKNAELWIIGEGPEKGSLEAIIKNLGLGDYVKLLGWHDNAHEFCRQVDVFMLTSYSEGWPLVILEAANYGLPIIMTDVGCAGEVIRDGESGIVIPVGGRRKLEEAMVKLIEDEGLRRGLGSGAREAVKRLPSKGEILGLYKESWKKTVL